MSEVSDEELLEQVREANDSRAVVRFVELAVEQEPDLNMLQSLRRFADAGDVDDMSRLGNEVEKAIWNDGLEGMRLLLRRADPDDSYMGEPYGANVDERQKRLLQQVVQQYR
jgi:hypothetical protein